MIFFLKEEKMNKKILLILIIMLSIFTVSNVSAANDSNIASENLTIMETQVSEELDVNPWMESSEGEEPIFRVDTSKNDFPANPVIIINGENENTRKLGIKELYNEQTDYVKDILDKIQAYNPATYLAIVRDFQGIVHTIADLERMVWGNYTDSSDSEKRPLAKLTADILEQYKKYL